MNTSDAYGRRSLDSWARLFSQQNPRVPGPGGAAENWLWFAGNVASPIAETVRTEEYQKCVPLIAHALKWLCCFVVKYSAQQHGERVRFGRRLSEIVWGKYPRMCYACAFKYTRAEVRSRRHLRCVCPAIRNEKGRTSLSRRDKERNARFLRLALRGQKRKPRTIDQWAKMIKHVYGPAHYEMSLPSICLHFIEEVGEVARALRQVQDCSDRDMAQCLRELEGELADVFSWCFGLFNKVDQFLLKAKDYYGQKGKKVPALRMSEALRAVIAVPVPAA